MEKDRRKSCNFFSQFNLIKTFKQCNSLYVCPCNNNFQPKQFALHTNKIMAIEIMIETLDGILIVIKDWEDSYV